MGVVAQRTAGRLLELSHDGNLAGSALHNSIMTQLLNLAKAFDRLLEVVELMTGPNFVQVDQNFLDQVAQTVESAAQAFETAGTTIAQQLAALVAAANAAGTPLPQANLDALNAALGDQATALSDVQAIVATPVTPPAAPVDPTPAPVDPTPVDPTTEEY